MEKPTKAAILEGDKATEQRIEYFREKAPYFPDYYIEVREPEFREEKAFHITTKVRHEHEGVWYARHHYTSYITDDINKAMKRFMRQVYLDIKFGSINPDFKRPNGEPLDPKDELQQSEVERFKLPISLVSMVKNEEG